MTENPPVGWGGERVVTKYDGQTRTWMFVCVDSTALGPAAGGTRMRVYPGPAEALRDGLRLGHAMTLKNAVAGLPLGGGKAVLAVSELPTGEARRALLLRYADLLESLGGVYWTASDMNTSPEDLDVIAERCSYVFGRSEASGGSGDSAPATAVGVFNGIRASARHAFGSDDLDGRVVMVQGVGGVGGNLVPLLTEAGAKVFVSDLIEERVREVSERHGAAGVPVDEAIATECDVFSPCAVGGIVSEESIPRMRTRVVAGAANNQLATPEDAGRLREAGILFAPDFVINAGGIMHLAAIEKLGWSSEELARGLQGIGETLLHVFSAAEATGATTNAAAEALALQRIRGIDE